MPYWGTCFQREQVHSSCTSSTGCAAAGGAELIADLSLMRRWGVGESRGQQAITMGQQASGDNTVDNMDTQQLHHSNSDQQMPGPPWRT